MNFAGSPNGTVVSPFHDVPLFANTEKTVLNMVVEIPRWTNSKMEVRWWINGSFVFVNKQRSQHVTHSILVLKGILVILADAFMYYYQLAYWLFALIISHNGWWQYHLKLINWNYRFLRRKSWTPSSRMLRKVHWDLWRMSSLTTAIYGTMVPSHR